MKPKIVNLLSLMAVGLVLGTVLSAVAMMVCLATMFASTVVGVPLLGGLGLVRTWRWVRAKRETVAQTVARETGAKIEHLPKA